MDNKDLMPLVLLRRIKNLRKAGYKVSYESNKDGLLVLKIMKGGAEEGTKHYTFYY